MKGRRGFDNISIAHTKSSKTIKNKLNNNPERQTEGFEPPYFREDRLIKQIEQRAEKQKLKSSQLAGQKKEDHLGKAGKIVQELFKRHRQAKDKLNKLKEQTEKQAKIECPFKPDKPKIQKYLIEGNVVRRNQIWLQEKRRKQIQRKQSIMLQNLNQCTFTPVLSAKKSNQKYLQNRSNTSLTKKQPSPVPPTDKTPKKKQLTLSPSNYMSKSSNKLGKQNKTSVTMRQKGDITVSEFQARKQELKTRIFNMS